MAKRGLMTKEEKIWMTAGLSQCSIDTTRVVLHGLFYHRIDHKIEVVVSKAFVFSSAYCYNNNNYYCYY